MPEATDRTMTAAEAVSPPITCSEPGCNKPPVSSYQWAWGETGNACAEHQFLLGQKAKNLKRSITFMALGPVQAPPITRDERTQLHAARLAAEDETAEAKARTARLYDQNQALATELGKANRRGDELQAAILQAANAYNQLRSMHDVALQELDKAKDEVVRLQTLVDALQGARVADPASEG